MPGRLRRPHAAANARSQVSSRGLRSESKRDSGVVPAGAVGSGSPCRVPQSGGDYLDRGISRYLKGDFDQAVADFQQAIRLDPGCALAYLNRGIAWKAVGEYGRAIADFTEAIDLDPKLTVAFVNRGLTVERGRTMTRPSPTSTKPSSSTRTTPAAMTAVPGSSPPVPIPGTATARMRSRRPPAPAN